MKPKPSFSAWLATAMKASGVCITPHGTVATPKSMGLFLRSEGRSGASPAPTPSVWCLRPQANGDTWSTAMQEAATFEVLHELVVPAKRNLSTGHWDYLMGGSETETTFERNRVALDSIAFRPRVLRNVEKVDTGGNLLGHSLRLPVVLAPIGSLQDLSPEGG